MTRYEFTTDELTKKAFAVYSDSSFTFWKDGDVFFYSDNPNSQKIELGTLEDVNEFYKITSIICDMEKCGISKTKMRYRKNRENHTNNK